MELSLFLPRNEAAVDQMNEAGPLSTSSSAEFDRTLPRDDSILSWDPTIDPLQAG